MSDINERIAALSPDKLQSLAKHLMSQRSQSDNAVEMAPPPETTGSDSSSQAQRDDEKSVSLSFVIPWSKRPELYMALRKNRASLAEVHTEVLVVTTGSDVAELKSCAGRIGIPGLRILEVQGAEFNKCCFLNLGAYCSRAERLFLLDCDTLVGRNTIEEASAALDETTFIVVREGIELDHVAHRELMSDIPCLREKVVTTELLFTNGNRASYEYFQSTTGRSLAGLMMLNRKDFLGVEGLNSQLQKWGAEDYDFQIRLQAKLGRRRVSLGSATHLTHPSNASDAGEVSHARNIESIFDNYNKGNFLGTYSQDVAKWGSKIRFV